LRGTYTQVQSAAAEVNKKVEEAAAAEIPGGGSGSDQLQQGSGYGGFDAPNGSSSFPQTGGYHGGMGGSMGGGGGMIPHQSQPPYASYGQVGSCMGVLLCVVPLCAMLL
jgi:hypothetical protein